MEADTQLLAQKLDRLIELQERKLVIPADLMKDRPKVYDTFTINLSTANNNKELPIVGNYLKAIESSNVAANIDIRFNEPMNNSIPFKKGRKSRTPFYRLFLTNTAQAGQTITFAFGALYGEFDLEDDSGFAGDVNVIQWGGTALTGKDITTDIAGTFSATGTMNHYIAGNATNIHKSAVQVGAGITIVHTVGGSTMDLLAYSLAGIDSNPTSNGTIYLRVRDAGDVYQYDLLVSSQQAGGGPCSPVAQNVATSPAQIPAAYDIYVESSVAGLDACGQIIGRS